MSSGQKYNRDLLISLTSEISKIHAQMKIIRDDIQYIKKHIDDYEPVVIDDSGNEEPVRGWFWS